jgi:hypothetical protein
MPCEQAKREREKREMRSRKGRDPEIKKSLCLFRINKTSMQPDIP